MIDFIDELFQIYSDRNDDVAASDTDENLKRIYNNIDDAISTDLSMKFGELLLADTQSAFRCSFKVAVQLLLKIYDIAKQ